MAIAMTPRQEQDFEEKGYVVLDDFLAAPEVGPSSRRGRRGRRAHQGILRTRPRRALPPCATPSPTTRPSSTWSITRRPCLSSSTPSAWNIQVRTSHLDYRPPYPGDMRAGAVGLGDGEDQEAGYRNVNWHPDLAGNYLFEAPSLDRASALHGDQDLLRPVGPQRIEPRQPCG